MPLGSLRHLLHPTDDRRTRTRQFRAACGRWVGIGGFVTVGNRPLCPKCAVAQFLHDLATPTIAPEDTP
jgi:hypothetical protein